MQTIKAILSSKQTTFCAILLVVITILQAVYKLVDADPATNPDWNEVVQFLVVAASAMFAGDAVKQQK